MTGIDLVKIFIGMFGGIALFIYGMSMLGSSLEKLSSGRMEKILESLTNNIFKSVLLGAFVTAAVQSSGATTVIVVGLVNAGILKLSSAVGVIMGANIGTTITGQILRLGDLENNAGVGSLLDLLSPSTLAPFISIIGIIIFMVSRSDNGKTTGEILLGVGILFTGMLSMTESVSPLSELPAFRTLFASLSNPILGVIVGAVVTAILQSSSASVGILQAISTTGVLSFSAAFPIIMGQNIGTCVVPIISSIGANKNAKRTAMVHLYFNIIGTILFLVVVYAIQVMIGFSFWEDTIDMGGIANFHTLFNIVVTAVFIPFHRVLEFLACKTIKDGETSDDDISGEEAGIQFLDDRLLKSPSLAIQQAMKTVITMGGMAKQNFVKMRTLFSEFDQKTVDNIHAREDIIDTAEDKLNAYLIKLTDCELTEYESRMVTALLHLLSEFERIGDYAINLVESAQEMNAKNLKFSEKALAEFAVISDAVEEIITMAVNAADSKDMSVAMRIEPLEEVIDYLNETLKTRHIDRLKAGLCNVDAGIVFLDMLINLERISDHCSNAGVYVMGINVKKDSINRHEYIQDIHQGKDQSFMDASAFYKQKYAID